MKQYQEVFRRRASKAPGATIGRSVLAFLTFWVAVAMGAEDGLKPWSANVDPSDVKKSHAEDITAGRHEYQTVQGGTMDGRNCRSPMGCGMCREGAMIQKWESNRSVRMENVGDSDVINPWLSNGRNNFRSAKEIVASATTPDMTDAEKAMAVWFQEIQYRYHDAGAAEQYDPVRVFNVYGYNCCGSDCIGLATLWNDAGMKAAPARALGHCISQVFYDNRWHFMDGDLDSIYLLRDNVTVASQEDFQRDHDLIRRTHSQGILLPDNQRVGLDMCSWYFDEGPVIGQRGHDDGTTMNMVLRPGEALVWRWGQTTPCKYHIGDGGPPVYPAMIADGLWEYRPDLSKDLWRKGAASVENIAASADGLAAAEGQTGAIVWTMRSPYVFVGGRLEAEGAGAQFSVCTDGKTWKPVTDSLDTCFPFTGPSIYQYKLKCELQGPARLRRLAIVNDLEMAPMALPEMCVGRNTFTYSDQSSGERRVRVTHNWVERSSSTPPGPPEAAVYPPDGGEASGTDITFQWKPSGQPASDYQFMLSSRPDMRWPLSMDFYKLISRTSDAGKPQYSLSRPGLLNPDKTCYWRVRSMNAKGVWGDWSKTWSFTPRAPGYPLNVAVDFDAAKNEGILRWQPNLAGNRPVKYRVYASDEKGFTVSDQPYRSPIGVTTKEMADWNPTFPANFIAETPAAQLPVLGCAACPNANRTYYRVVAVDDHGKRSGPSDFATSPRPVIYSKPVATAKVGAEYRYQASATRSLGDLSARMKGNNIVSGYFDIEKPAFTLEQGPAWLKIDPATGVLSGTPDAAGKVEVAVSTTINHEVRKLNKQDLIWGSEKVLSTANERVGAATQKFVIVVE